MTRDCKKVTLKDIKLTIQTMGAVNYLLYVLNRALKKLSNKLQIVKYYFFSQPVRQQPMIKNPEKRNIKVSRTMPDDVIVQQFPRPDEVIKDRFDQDAYCYTAIRNNKFVGFIWYCEKVYHEDEVRCKFMPTPATEAVWDFDVYIEPDNRMSLAFPLLWDKVNESLSEKNYGYTLSRISAFNCSSSDLI